LKNQHHRFTDCDDVNPFLADSNGKSGDVKDIDEQFIDIQSKLLEDGGMNNDF